MKNICDIVQDILPLYVDNVCSETSREFVEEHLPECKKCSGTLEMLKSTVYENDVLKEKETVLQHNYKKNRNRTFVVGGIISSILMIPVIVCLIVNIATGHALDWFFIVLAALLVVASITVVPLVTTEKRFLYSSLSFLGTLLILLAVVCIYSRGRWFFMAALSVLMGAATVILPIIAGKYFPDGFWKKNKGLLVYGTDTLLLLLLLLSISAYTRSASFFRYALPITAVSGLAMWILFLIIRYWRVHPVVRAGGFMIFLGVFVMFINPLISCIIGDPMPSLVAQDQYINTYIGLGGIIAGIVFMVMGAACSAFKKNKDKKAIKEDKDN